jgi:hypothetical protein
MSGVYDDESNGGMSDVHQREVDAAKGHPGTETAPASEPEDIAAREAEGAEPAAAGGEGGNLYNPEGSDSKGGEGGKDGKGKDKKRKGFFKRKKVIFLVIGILLGGGVGIEGFSILQGPFEAIHIAKLEAGIHLSENEDESDELMTKIMRYLRMPNKPQNTRMGYLGNKFADKFESRFNANGVSSAYTKIFGYLDGYIIDPAKLGGDFQPANGKNEADVKDFFKKNYNIDLQTHAENHRIPPGKLFASAKGMGYFKTKSLIRSIATGSGYGKTTAYLVTRLHSKRAGNDLHPMKKVAKNVKQSLEERFIAWRQKEQKTIQNGETETITTTNDANPKDKNATADAQNAQSQTDQTIQDVQAAGESASSGDPSKLSALAKVTALKVSASALNAIGILCLAEGYSADYDHVVQQKIILPRIRLAMQREALGNQVMDNGPDTDLEQLGFFSRNYYDKKTNTTWADAPSIQQQVGERVTGPPIPSYMTVNKKGNILTQILNAVPGLNTVCKGVNSPVGQILTLGISFIGGPASAIVSAAVGVAIQQAIPSLLNWLSGQQINVGLLFGAFFGSGMDYGFHDSSNDIAASTGGSILTMAEVTKLFGARGQADRQEFQRHNLAYRLFDPYDPQTLVSRFMDQQSPNAGDNVNRMASGLFNFIPNLFGSLQGVLFHRTSAATITPWEYDEPYIGKPLEQIDSRLTNNPYTNADDVVNNILPGPDGKKLIKRAEVCNGIALGTDGTVVSTGQVPPMYDIVNPENHCSDRSDEWTRVSNYIHATEVMEGMACDTGDAQSCQDIGFDTGTLTDATAPKTTMRSTGGDFSILGLLPALVRNAL